jgi:hypothetical protein
MPTVTPLPFDPTGTSPLNKVVNEQQVITAVNFRDYHYIIPNLAPFFSDSVVMSFKNPDGSSRTLTEGVDFYYSHSFISASRACAKPIYGSIEFLFSNLAGVLNLTYQSIGGNWTIDAQTIADILANSLHNPRTTSWEQIVELPVMFPVIDHEWDLVDLVGASEVVDALDQIRDAISSGGNNSGLAAHIADHNNPHQTSAAQVGLGNVANYPIASSSQAQQGTNATTYMTPLLTAQAITALGQSNLNAHLSDFNNPHQVSKSQVGLSLVDNFATASVAQVQAGSATNLFVTPAGVGGVVTPISASLTSHIANQANPHQVTKSQILLGNVQNYPVSTAQQAIAGTDDASYMTPLKTANAIAAQSSTGLANHLADHNNPHVTTAQQVGLGNVDNFLTATQLQAQQGTVTNAFMTPALTAAAITSQVGNSLLAHINDSNNPHSTTAAQLGLGSVQNYGISDQNSATAGTSNVLYMTPLRVAQAITFQVGTAFAAHVAARNPHGTTASDVGLGNVQNYPIADDSTAAAGTSTTTYLTPHGASLLTGGPSALANHIADHNNPHVVTASQVGLGNVQNYGLATTQQAQTGTNTQTYMTPALTAAAITTQAQVLVNAHATRTDNPHATTASQVGAYSTTQIDQQMSGKLGVTDVASDSTLFNGKTEAQFGAVIDAEVQSALSSIGINGTFREMLLSNHEDSANTTHTYTWASLGTLKAINVANQLPAEAQAAKSDLAWIISGGEDPSAPYGVTTLLQMSIRGAGADPTSYTLTDLTPALATQGVDFGYVWDSTNSVATVYARMPSANNQLTVNELCENGGGINVSYLGFASPPAGVVMMTRTPSIPALEASVATLQSQVAALQAQVNTLTTDLVSGLAALTAQINAM